MDELDLLIEGIDPRIVNKIKDDTKKKFFKKALERMHKMVQKDGGKSSIGNIAFEITRQVSMGLTSREFEKAYKQVYGIKEDAPTNSVAGGGVSLPPDARFKPINVTDKRRRKDKPPVMLKRFKPFSEATYKGKEVTLNKPTAGDVAKSKVYVDVDGDGKATKVNFGHGGTSAKKAGEKTMRIRKDNPKARKSFRARHNCDNPGPKDKARYWSCKAW